MPDYPSGSLYLRDEQGRGALCIGNDYEADGCAALGERHAAELRGSVEANTTETGVESGAMNLRRFGRRFQWFQPAARQQ